MIRCSGDKWPWWLDGVIRPHLSVRLGPWWGSGHAGLLGAVVGLGFSTEGKMEALCCQTNSAQHKSGNNLGRRK